MSQNNQQQATSDTLDHSIPLLYCFPFPGYVCEEHNNPPDFFLDVLNEDSSAVQNLTDDPTTYEAG